MYYTREPDHSVPLKKVPIKPVEMDERSVATLSKLKVSLNKDNCKQSRGEETEA